MLEVICSLSIGFSKTFEKVKHNIFYDSKERLLYKWGNLPIGTLLRNDDIIRINSSSLTLYDGRYLIINLLYKDKQIKKSNIPKYLQHLNWESFTKLSTNQEIYEFDLDKTLKFLQKKADKLDNFIKDEVLRAIKPIQIEGKKTLHYNTINLLKTQIPQQLVNQLVKQKYQPVIDRKIQPIRISSEMKKKNASNKIRNQSKQKPIHISKSQTKLDFIIKDKKI